MSEDFFTALFTTAVPRPAWVANLPPGVDARDILRRWRARPVFYKKERIRPLVSLDQEQRRLAKYERYRNSEKGRARMQRYSISSAKHGADSRYRGTVKYFLAESRRRIAFWEARIAEIDASLVQR